MTRANLKHLLQDVELRVQRGQRNADRQREGVWALECADHDAAIAKRLLILFEKSNEIHVIGTGSSKSWLPDPSGLPTPPLQGKHLWALSLI